MLQHVTKSILVNERTIFVLVVSFSTRDINIDTIDAIFGPFQCHA